MHVDDAERRHVDDALRNDLAVADHHHGVGTQGRQVRQWLRPLDAFRLVHGKRAGNRSHLHGRGRQRTAPAFGPIGLRVDCQHLVARRQNAFERGHGERRRSQKDQAHYDRSLTVAAL